MTEKTEDKSAFTDWGIDLALQALGIYDPGQRQTVLRAIPVTQALVGHVQTNKALFDNLYADVQTLLPQVTALLQKAQANKPLFDTLYADFELILPAINILLGAINTKRQQL